MEEVRYMISDAANLLHMESHVLRYWEEELDLKIPRNEMGHRYYTKENLQQFEQIRSLKEQEMCIRDRSCSDLSGKRYRISGWHRCR